MRNIYENKKLNWPIQQGVIFNNCLADSYHENVFGIIITPRCDIENKKVKTLHYLPIIKFEDWVKNDLLIKFQEDFKKNQKGIIIKILKENDISINLLNGIIPVKDLNTIIEEKITNSKKLSSAKDCIQTYFDIDDSHKAKKIFSEKTSIRDRLIKDLQEGRNKDFYLIEDWKDKEKYRVVLLREVKRISFDLGEKISKGVLESDIIKRDLNSNDIVISDDKDGIIFIEAKMNSPFIEHLLQSFFHNFGRIGVDNFDENTNESLINETIKSLNI